MHSQLVNKVVIFLLMKERRVYFYFVCQGIFPERLHHVKETFQPFHAAAEFNAVCFFPWAQKHISECNNPALKGYCLPTLKTKILYVAAQASCRNLALKCSLQEVLVFHHITKKNAVKFLASLLVPTKFKAGWILGVPVSKSWGALRRCYFYFRH